jgi:hypothetical protein
MYVCHTLIDTFLILSPAWVYRTYGRCTDTFLEYSRLDDQVGYVAQTPVALLVSCSHGTNIVWRAVVEVGVKRLDQILRQAARAMRDPRVGVMRRRKGMVVERVRYIVAGGGLVAYCRDS